MTQVSSETRLSPDELALVKRYRALPPERRRVVLGVIEDPRAQPRGLPPITAREQERRKRGLAKLVGAWEMSDAETQEMQRYLNACENAAT